MPEGIELVADRSAIDWTAVDDMSETIGERDCMITNAVALVVLRLRSRAGTPPGGPATEAELHEACMFIRWKLNGIDDA